MEETEQRRKIKRWLAICLLVLLAVPFVAYSWWDSAQTLFRPSGMVYVFPSEFQAAFNQYMQPHGISINLGNTDHGFGTSKETRNLALLCTDGSQIDCTIQFYNTNARSCVQEVRFEQTMTPDTTTCHLSALMDTLLVIFQPSLADDRDEKYHDTMSWNQALKSCEAFIESERDAARLEVSDKKGMTQEFILERMAEEAPVLALQLNVYTFY